MKLQFTPDELVAMRGAPVDLDSLEGVIEAFHRLSYDEARRGKTWHATRFRGYAVYKLPSDLWLYRDLFESVRPRTVIETGTAEGGSALYYAALMDEQEQGGIVITIDVKPLSPNYPAHSRIFYVPDRSSLDGMPQAGRHVQGEVSYTAAMPPSLKGPVVVVLDSDHAEKHVRQELDIYAPLVTVGSYLVVEDTNVGGHPALPEHGPGPREALDDWLPSHPEFKEDHAIGSRHLFSYHTWLRRVSQ